VGSTGVDVRVSSSGRRAFYEAEWHVGGKEIEIGAAPHGRFDHASLLPSSASLQRAVLSLPALRSP